MSLTGRTPPHARVSRHGPVTSECPIEGLLTFLSPNSFSPLARTCDAPYGEPRAFLDLGTVLTAPGCACQTLREGC
jgi:hypothetical protein